MAEHLVLTNRARRCRRCRTTTLHALESQLATDTGLCLDHATGHPFRDAPAHTREAIGNLAAAFDLGIGDTTDPPPAPRTTISGTWTATGLRWTAPITPPGTCRCGGTVVHYGPGRRPWCRTCHTTEGDTQ